MAFNRGAVGIVRRAARNAAASARILSVATVTADARNAWRFRRDRAIESKNRTNNLPNPKVVGRDGCLEKSCAIEGSSFISKKVFEGTGGGTINFHTIPNGKKKCTKKF